MKRIAAGVATAAVALTPLAVTSAADASQAQDQRPRTYNLQGDEAGSMFEGIGVDRQQRTFYVSETTGGEIHRGNVLTGKTKEWKPEGADGRTTARGITVDSKGRVYIAGGPNGQNNQRPDLWVYGKSGKLLAKLRVSVKDAFLNDVAIGPDGAAYFTNSDKPQIFRVAKSHGKWKATKWSDTPRIKMQEGFNLGGIVTAPNNKSFIVAQGNTGDLWRISRKTHKATHIKTGKANLVNADGLVRRGNALFVVRNFDKKLVRMHLGKDARSANVVAVRNTDQDRVFTTAKLARGRLLAVDSKFDEGENVKPPYQVVALEVRH